ncbi:hypothetical protein [Alicyclobacillus sp. SO9]|uniref:hypothetical protein n=1 Tax=Alicyclobacillus sp. SO9 TaxID=2665646 RepID=UPI0018E8FF26|nr:hypothetical protein [Alicyclobacillus sp. SO9]
MSDIEGSKKLQLDGNGEVSTRNPYKTAMITLSIAIAVNIFVFLVGFFLRGSLLTLSVMSTSIVNAVAGATAAVVAGFGPWVGAIISSLTHLSFLPFLLFSFNDLVERWKWFQRKLAHIDKVSEKYKKYGVWLLIPLSATAGIEVSVGVGVTLRFNTVLILLSILFGVFASTILTTMTGEGLRHLFLSF